MKEIPLSRGKVALVDDEDFEHLNQWKWCVHPRSGYFYAARGASNYAGGKKHSIISMHRYIMGVADPKVIVDHKDRNTLNNQKGNLRICNKNQNQANRNPKKNGTSKYLGVSYNKARRKWSAQLTSENKQIRLGFFTSEIDAALAYNYKAKEIHGEFANLNILP